jgi:CelD/BcsL family acetyltransferase involved in cellulose biosynthesis
LSDLDFHIINSTANLRANADAWNDLWRRSDWTLPPLRAEQLALWSEYFDPRAELRAVVVTDGSRWLAALPLIGRRSRLLPGRARLPNNFYSTSGELLFDRQAESEVADRLVAGLRQLPWGLLWLNFVSFEMRGWQELLAAARRLGVASFAQRSFEIGRVELDCDYRTYEASRSRNHRRSIKRTTDRINELGGCEVQVLAPTPDDDIEALLRRGFEVEDRCWKAESGSSVLRSPGVFEFYVRQARELASNGELRLAFLEHQGHPIAFEYAWAARGGYVSQKVGYDASFAECSPGQLLRAKLYERFCESGETKLIDYRGILSEATARWATQSYSVGRVLLGTRTWSKVIVRGYERSWPRYLKLRTALGRPAPSTLEIRPLRREATNSKQTKTPREPVAANP